MTHSGIFCWKRFHFILYSYLTRRLNAHSSSSLWIHATVIYLHQGWVCQTLQEFLPADHHPSANPPLTANVPLREVATIKDWPSPSKSLRCHRSSTTRLQTKNHLWRAKGIYCLSFEEFCTQASPARGWRHANVHITHTIGSRRKGPEGALRCPHMAVLAVTWA